MRHHTAGKRAAKRNSARNCTNEHLIDIPQAAKAIEDFSQGDQAVIQRLDEIFWSEIPKMFVGKFLMDVVTVGGEQKAEAIRRCSEAFGRRISRM